jgi:hypothetical protein
MPWVARLTAPEEGAAGSARIVQEFGLNRFKALDRAVRGSCKALKTRVLLEPFRMAPHLLYPSATS